MKVTQVTEVDDKILYEKTLMEWSEVLADGETPFRDYADVALALVIVAQIGNFTEAIVSQTWETERPKTILDRVKFTD